MSIVLDNKIRVIDPVDAANNIINAEENNKDLSDRKVLDLHPQDRIESEILESPRSLKGRVNCIQSLLNAISALFYKIFCYSKWKNTPIDHAFAQVINDESTIESSKHILLAKGHDGLNDYKLIPFKPGRAVEMPQQFVLDLHRGIQGFKINGKSYNTHHLNIKEREAIVAKMKRALGDNGAIAAGRLLNQSGIGHAYVKLQEKSFELEGFMMRQVGGFYCEIETRNDEVILTLRQIYQGYNPDQEKYDGKHVGVVVSNRISLEELDHLGALSPQEARDLDDDFFDIEASYTFTDSYRSKEGVKTAFKS